MKQRVARQSGEALGDLFPAEALSEMNDEGPLERKDLEARETWDLLTSRCIRDLRCPTFPRHGKGPQHHVLERTRLQGTCFLFQYRIVSTPVKN